MALYWAVIPLFEPGHQNSKAASRTVQPTTEDELNSSELSWSPAPQYASSSRDNSPNPLDHSSPCSTDSLDMELLKVAASVAPSSRTGSSSPTRNTFQHQQYHQQQHQQQLHQQYQSWGYSGALPNTSALSSGPASPMMGQSLSLPTIQGA